MHTSHTQRQVHNTYSLRVNKANVLKHCFDWLHVDMMEAILVPLTHALHVALQPTIFKMAAIALIKAQITDVKAKEDVITMLSEPVKHIHLYTHTLSRAYRLLRRRGHATTVHCSTWSIMQMRRRMLLKINKEPP